MHMTVPHTPPLAQHAPENSTVRWLPHVPPLIHSGGRGADQSTSGAVSASSRVLFNMSSDAGNTFTWWAPRESRVARTTAYSSALKPAKIRAWGSGSMECQGAGCRGGVQGSAGSSIVNAMTIVIAGQHTAHIAFTAVSKVRHAQTLNVVQFGSLNKSQSLPLKHSLVSVLCPVSSLTRLQAACICSLASSPASLHF